MIIRTVLFEKPAEHMLGNLLAFLRYVCVDADVEIGAIEFLGAGDFIEEVGEPQEVVLVADLPVEVNSTVVDIWRGLLGCFRGTDGMRIGLYMFEFVMLEVGQDA